MALCFLKNAELEKALQKYKGRVVLRGDQVKDEHGFQAVFTEQGASASHMVAAKSLDGIARMPGMAGSAADARSAYTQVPLSMLSELLQIPEHECQKIWVSLPRDRWPKHWRSIEDPVVPLDRNLYGHPLAGLLWEKYLEHQLSKIGWRKVRGWECLYLHPKDKLFLSVYVDDFKLVGKQANIKPMWAKIRKYIELDPETPMVDRVYLGCTQREVQPNRKVIEEKQKLFAQLMSKKTPEPKEGVRQSTSIFF